MSAGTKGRNIWWQQTQWSLHNVVSWMKLQWLQLMFSHTYWDVQLCAWRAFYVSAQNSMAVICAKRLPMLAAQGADRESSYRTINVHFSAKHWPCTSSQNATRALPCQPLTLKIRANLLEHRFARYGACAFVYKIAPLAICTSEKLYLFVLTKSDASCWQYSEVESYACTKVLVLLDMPKSERTILYIISGLVGCAALQSRFLSATCTRLGRWYCLQVKITCRSAPVQSLPNFTLWTIGMIPKSLCMLTAVQTAKLHAEYYCP